MSRFLLDQGFPKPVEAVQTLLGGVSFTHLYDFDPALAEQEHPDWLLVLAAADGGFEALVTRNNQMIAEEPDALIALCHTDLTLVTWDKVVDDPILEWGQLLGYLPQILRVMGQEGPRILKLPTPRLDKRHIAKASDKARELAPHRFGTSYAELRAGARAQIHQKLGELGRASYRRFLES